MKNFLISLLVLGALSLAAYFLINNDASDTAKVQGFVINKNTPAGEEAEAVNWTRPKKNNKDEKGIKYAIHYLRKMRANPDGEYNPMDYYRARVALKNRSMNAQKSSTLSLEWESLGPDNIAGRSRAFLVDQNDSSKLYTGGVTAGLFISNDMGESWELHPQTDEWDFLGVSSIQQASNGDLYFGTGEYFVQTLGNGSGHIGGGIYKSTDNGETFSVIPSTVPNPNDDNDDWSYVTEIAIDPNDPQRILATRATENRAVADPGGGITISEDGGQTWNTPSQFPAGDANREALDVKINENGVIFLCQNRKYFRSEDGNSFELRSGIGGFPSTGVERIEFAIAPTDPNFVYALISNGNEALRGIYKSEDAGLTWEAISPENSETFNPLGSQGFYDMCIAVSPADKDRAYVGGQLEMYAGQSGGWNLIATSFSGRTSGYYIHADMHGIFPHPKNPDIVFVTSDGGSFKSLNATALFPSFQDANKNQITTQFYTIYADDLGRSIGGTQDNGMQLVNGQGNNETTSDDLEGFGDGGYGAISNINREAVFGQSQFGALKRSSNGGQAFGGFYDEKVDAVNNQTNDAPGDGLPDVGTEFIAEGLLWESNPEDVNFEIDLPNTPWVDTFVTVSDKKAIFFIGANGRLFFTPEALNFSIQPRWFEISTNGTVTTISDAPDGTIFAGTSNGNLYKIDGFTNKYKYETVLIERLMQVQVDGRDTTVEVVDKNIRLVPDYPENNIDDWTWPSTNVDYYKGITREEIGSGLPSRYITGIGVDPNFATTGQLVITFPGYNRSSYVYKSTGTNGFNFTDITNNLILAPAYDALIDANNPDNIILATDIGIFSSNDGGASWEEDNAGIYRTPVFKLNQANLYEEGCPVIYAGTYGRGIFRTTTLTPAGCDTKPYKGVGTSVEEPIANIKDVKEGSLTVYPNPATSFANIEVKDADFENDVVVSIIDISGKTVYQKKVATNTIVAPSRNQVDVSAFESGYYIISVSDGKSALTQKIMVK